MCVVWSIAYKIRNPGLIDLGWEVGMIMSGLIYLSLETIHLKQIGVGLVLILWGARLGYCIFASRIKPGIVEKRYIAMSQTWRVFPRMGFLIHFQLQVFFYVYDIKHFLFG
jgi:steroid 5-alpha reductase family enzyme